MVSFGNGDFAFVGRFFPDHHAEERGLTRAIGSDQTHLLAGIQLERSVHEDQAVCRTAC